MSTKACLASRMTRSVYKQLMSLSHKKQEADEGCPAVLCYALYMSVVLNRTQNLMQSLLPKTCLVCVCLTSESSNFAWTLLCLNLKEATHAISQGTLLTPSRRYKIDLKAVLSLANVQLVAGLARSWEATCVDRKVPDVRSRHW